MKTDFPEGQKGFGLAQNASEEAGAWWHVVEREEDSLYLQVLHFCAPQLQTIYFPAWDCLPYDRLSPSKDILIARVQALEALRVTSHHKISTILLLTPQALMQKVPASFGKRAEEASLRLQVGDKISREHLP